jgi:hypothetical protein
MGFNKRFISKSSLLSAASNGLDYLISYVTKPDALIIESDGISNKVCDIVFLTKDKLEVKQKLKEIGFYEFKY